MFGPLAARSDEFFRHDAGFVPRVARALETPLNGPPAPVARRSHEQIAALEAARAAMEAAGTEYEAAYWDAGALDAADTTYKKLYLMSVGVPGAADVAVKEKTATALVGEAYRTAVVEHLAQHNSPDGHNARTRASAPHWRLVFVLFFPQNGVPPRVRRLVQDFWSAAHGIDGKLKRGLEMARLFNLRYYVPPECAAFVADYERPRAGDAAFRGRRVTN